MQHSLVTLHSLPVSAMSQQARLPCLRSVSEPRVTSCSSTASLTAAALSLGLAAAFLHPADFQGRLDAADRLLDIMNDESQAEGLRAAAAEALGIFVAETSAEMQDEVSACTRREIVDSREALLRREGGKMQAALRHRWTGVRVVYVVRRSYWNWDHPGAS